MRLFIGASTRMNRWLLLILRIVIDHIERDRRETEAPEDLLRFDSAYEGLEKFAGRAIAEHDLLLLIVLPAEDEESFVHAVKKLDVLFVRELELCM